MRHIGSFLLGFIREKMTSPTVYRSVESVLNVLKIHKKHNPGVETLLLEYDKTLANFDENDNKEGKKHPFIVLEGLDGCGKSTFARRLSQKFGGKQWCTPPASIKHIRASFDENLELRTAYYALGNYIAALQVGLLLHDTPVVMDRYWHSTAAFAIAQAVNDQPGLIELPPEGDSFYEWPSDLLKPDIILYMEVSEGERLRRLSRRTQSTGQEDLLKKSKQFRDNVTLAYKNMYSPEVVFIDCDSSINATMREIIATLKHLF